MLLIFHITSPLNLTFTIQVFLNLLDFSFILSSRAGVLEMFKRNLTFILLTPLLRCSSKKLKTLSSSLLYFFDEDKNPIISLFCYSPLAIFMFSLESNSPIFWSDSGLFGFSLSKRFFIFIF